MASTVTQVPVGGRAYNVVGSQRESVVDVTWTTTYVTGGEAVAAAQAGLNVIEQVVSAQLLTTVASGTAVDANVVPAATGATAATKLVTAVGEVANAGVAIGTVVRVTVRGR